MKHLLSFSITVTFATYLQLFTISCDQYDPTWPSIDSRPLPDWYDEAKFGIFMHWGVFSVPSFGSEWFWYYWQGYKDKSYIDFMQQNYKPGFTYADFGPMFTAEFFDPNRFASIIKNSGARYVVFTSKHHEGFTNWPSKYSWNWNSVDVGPNRDLVGELATAIRTTAPNVTFGLYFSLFEWFHPLWLEDQKNGFTTKEYNDLIMWPEIKELVNTYKPEVLWSDGAWLAADAYWNSTDFLAWLYNESPVKDTIVTNDRWGNNTQCLHGGFYSCNDKYNPGVLQKHKWENCMTVDHYSWGFRRQMTISDVLTIQDLIEQLMSTISCGGNLLMNIGPTHDGRIVPVFEERLTQMGQWLNVNGEAVYSSKPWIHQNDTINPGIWYTSQMKRSGGLNPRRLFNPQISANTVVYATVLNWPNDGQLPLGAIQPTTQTTVTMLGYAGRLSFEKITKNGLPFGIVVDLNGLDWKSLPNTWAWVLKIENLATSSRQPDIFKPVIRKLDNGTTVVTGQEKLVMDAVQQKIGIASLFEWNEFSV